MAKETLTAEDCQRGAELVRALVSAGFPVGFAGWLLDSDDPGEPFRLYIATQLWDVDGPVETASLLDRFFGLHGVALGFEIDDVEIGPSTADTMRQLREGLHVGVDSFSDEKWDKASKAIRDETFFNVQRVYVSQPEQPREAVKVARRAFETYLTKLEAA